MIGDPVVSIRDEDVDLAVIKLLRLHLPPRGLFDDSTEIARSLLPRDDRHGPPVEIALELGSDRLWSLELKPPLRQIHVEHGVGGVKVGERADISRLSQFAKSLGDHDNSPS